MAAADPAGRELPPTAGLPVRPSDFFQSPEQSLLPALGDWLGLPDPIPACSGTAAFVVLLHALRERDPHKKDVIIPAYSCPLVPLAVTLVEGLRPVVCDTLPGSFEFHPDALAALCGTDTLAIVPTHLGGRIADLDPIRPLARQHGIAVVEDAAQALGARVHGNSIGLAGDAVFFSLAAGKGLTTYEGGVLFSRDPGLRPLLKKHADRLLRPQFLLGVRRVLELAGYAWLYMPERLGRVYGRNLRRCLDRGDEAGAIGDRFSLRDIPLHSLGRYRLRVAGNAFARLPGFLEAGRERALRRVPLFNALDGVRCLADRPGENGTWPFFMVLMPDRAGRDQALRRLWRAGLGVSKLFARALPDYDFLGLCFPEPPPPCPGARDFADRLLTVTNSHWLREEEFERILRTLGECA